MNVRPISEADIDRVIAIYRAIYGEHFPFKEFYDATWVKKGVFDDEITWVVAEDDDGRVIGSAAVMLNAGDADDLIGEFGRLVVDPDSRTHGTGTELMRARIEQTQSQIEWGFTECRTAHPGAQKISERNGFRPVGFEPLAYQLMERRESVVLMARLFGNAARLRKNNPRVLATVFPLGCQAMENVGLEPDLIVADDVPAYPADAELQVEELQGENAYRLLRIGSGRAWQRELFGSMRLEYGFLKLMNHSAQYLVARREGVLVGAIGFTYDPIDCKVRIFELIAADDAVKGALLARFHAYVAERHRPAYIEASVSAHAPRMQATLEQMGFFPAAFCPAMVFQNVERLDIVKMVKLAVPWDLGPVQLQPGPARMKALVQQAFEEVNRGQTILDVAREVAIFQGLGDREIAAIRSICRERCCGAGQALFRRGEASKELFLLTKGRVRILAAEAGPPIAEINAGEALGEMALLDDQPRSADAVCAEPCVLLAISYGEFHELMNRLPQVGKVVFRNLARTLSGRLRDADRLLG